MKAMNCFQEEMFRECLDYVKDKELLSDKNIEFKIDELKSLLSESSHKFIPKYVFYQISSDLSNDINLKILEENINKIWSKKNDR